MILSSSQCTVLCVFVGQGIRKNNFCFFLNPLFWRPSSSAVIRDHEQDEQMIGSGGQTDVQCEPVPAELASKSVIVCVC